MKPPAILRAAGLLLFPLFLFAGATALAQGEPPAEASPPAPELVLPDSPAAALAMGRELEDMLEGRQLAELEKLLDSWIGITRRQSVAVERALAEPVGTREHDAAVALRSELDALLSAADTIVGAALRTGGDVEQARRSLDALRPDAVAALEASTVPDNRNKALELPIEVLKAQLRPLTREQVSAQLAQWLEFLQITCLEVSNVEVSALWADDPEQVATINARAVSLRAERAALIKRVEAVITALERKGGDVTDARTYVGSVVSKPAITGWYAAWSTARAWLTDKEGGVAAALSLAIAVAILAAFWFLAKGVGRIASRATRSLPRASALLSEFITTSAQRLTILIGILIALSTLGINMTPLVAAIGAAGLVIGLALQGTLGNLASGLMIMVYRPFDVGDSVQVVGVAGKVDGMTLMTTAVKTFDNQTIHIPNNKIWGDVITNVTANRTRRVDMKFGIGYGDDFAKARQILERIVTGHEKVLADPPPNIRVHELGDSSVNLIVRPWANTVDYWDVYWDVTEQVKRAFDAEGISIPFPQRDVHVIPAPGSAAEAPAPSETSPAAGPTGA